MNIFWELQAARRAEADAAFDSVRDACEAFEIDREAYVAAYLSRLVPITITTDGTDYAAAYGALK